MSKTLVLGSSGQIGTYLTTYLRDAGHTVIEFDITNHPTQDLRVVSNPILLKAVSDSDFVFFLAFDVGGSHYLEKYQDSANFISNNLQIMANTFEILNSSGKPFLFASSQMSNMSQSTYGLLKSIGEKYTAALNGIVVKFWNVYGIEKSIEKYHVISDFIAMGSRGEPIRMRTSGSETRDFLYADECCRGLKTIMDNYMDLSLMKEIHLANFTWTSIFEIAEIVAGHYNVGIMRGESEDSVQSEVKNYPSTDILKFWQPEVGIEDGIKKIIQDFESSV